MTATVDRMMEIAAQVDRRRGRTKPRLRLHYQNGWWWVEWHGWHFTYARTSARAIDLVWPTVRFMTTPGHIIPR